MYAEFPPGVRIEGDRIVDEVAGFSAQLRPAIRELLAPFASGADVAAVLDRNPASWALIQELNREHMLNLLWAGSKRALSVGRACHRYAVDGRNLAATGAVLARALTGLVLTCPAFTGLLAGAGVLSVFLPGPASVVVLFCMLHALAGYLVHEFGHAAAAAALRVPSYVLVDRLGLSVWARLDRSPLHARVFAAAGPMAAVAVGLIVLAALAPLGPWQASFHAAPYLLHFVALVPPSHDGRILWGIAGHAAAGMERP